MKNDVDEQIEIVAHVWNEKKETRESGKQPLKFAFAADVDSSYPEIAISGGNLPDSLWIDLRDLRAVLVALNAWAKRTEDPKWSEP